MRSYRIWIVLSILILAALACNAPSGSGDATITPTSQPPSIPTSMASVTPRSDLPATPTQGAITQATSTAPGPRRISFETGAISASVNGSLSTVSTQSYLINAAEGQTMTLNLTISEGIGVLGVEAPNGTSLLSESDAQTSASILLPADGDYTITVTLTEGTAATFTLDVTIPPVTAGANCWVTANAETDAYRESSPDSSIWGTAPAGEKSLLLARTNDGWVGFDPAVAQAGNEGRARLRWYNTASANLTYEPEGCLESVPLVLSMSDLEDGTYFVNGMQDVTLTNGLYENTAFDFETGTGSDVYSTHMSETMAFGDLNGDGLEDALVVLATNTGGTGVFVEMFAVLNNGGEPSIAAVFFVDDRGAVNSLRIADGEITADVLVHGPNDGGCCPSKTETWLLNLVGSELVKQPTPSN